MEVHDDHLPADEYARFQETMPQVCVELVLATDEGVLLGKRAIEPRIWFWPGSRLYKGEELEGAAHRVAAEELGIDVVLTDRLGVHAHFWAADETPEGASRHTVNVVFRAEPRDESFAIDLDEGHEDYRFLSESDPTLHEYVREYVETYDLLDHNGRS